MPQNSPLNDANAEQKETGRRRPGPFGPAWVLLPKDQQPLVLDGTTPACDAIERLIDNGDSQIPAIVAGHGVKGGIAASQLR